MHNSGCVDIYLKESLRGVGVARVLRTHKWIVTLVSTRESLKELVYSARALGLLLHMPRSIHYTTRGHKTSGGAW